MGRVQIADDPGVKIRAPWLGPAGAWRWPWDASYTSWALWAGTTAVGGALLHLAIPVVLVVAGAAYGVSRYTAALLAPERTKLVRRSLYWTLMLLSGLSVPSWRFWVFPMSFWVSLVVAPLLAVWVVRKWGKYVDSNRPLAYWLTVPGAAARGPRLDKEDEIDPTRLDLGLKMADLSDETGPIEYTVPVQTWLGKADLVVPDAGAANQIDRWMGRKPRYVTKKVNPAEKRLVPTSKDQHSTKFIARTEQGLRIGNTEFRKG